MRLKLFENHQDKEFEATISRKDVDVDIYDAPIEYRGASVTGGAVKWVLDIQAKRSGYELDSPKLTYLYFIMEVENEDEEIMEEIDIEIPRDGFEWNQFTSEFHKFPLYLRSIEINMNHTLDTEFWKYKLIIGDDER